MHGIIYKISNDINSNCYIGQTTSSLNHRWTDHKQEARALIHHNKLYSAMYTIGIEHFHINLVEEFTDVSPEELDEREQYWIKYYDSFNNGYNSTHGGKIGYRNTIPIICYTLSGKLYKEYDTVGAAANDLNINYDSIITYLNSPKQESCGGFQFKYKDSNRIINNYSNQINFNAKKCYFIQYDLNGNYINHYLSSKDASIKSNCQESGIVRCANHQINYSGEFIWRHGFYGDEIPLKISVNIPKNINKGKKRKIIYLNQNNEPTIYNSLSEAARITGYSRHKITYNCDIFPNTTIVNGRFKYYEE